MASARSISWRPVDEPACDVVRRPDGQPVLTLAPNWSGLPLGLFTIPGCEERGASETPYPTLLVAQRGQGERWYRSALHTRHLHTAPGMVELYPAGLEFERMRWQGEAGQCIAVQFQPDALLALTHQDRQIDLLREHEVFDERLQWLAGELLQSALSPDADALYVEGLSLALLGRLVQRGSVASRQRQVSGQLSTSQQQRLRLFIAESLGSELSVARLAAEVHLSPEHFAHCFKNTYGVPPYRFIRQERVNAAQRLLQRSSLSIAQIAAAVGFASQSHFTQVFRQDTGHTPAQWQRM